MVAMVATAATVTRVNYPALLARLSARSLRAGLSPWLRFRPAPVRGRGAVHDDGSRAGFCPGLATPDGLQRPSGTDAPEAGWSAHPTLILGGLEWARLRCRDAPSSPSSGPVYDGPCKASVLATLHYHDSRPLHPKALRNRGQPTKIGGYVPCRLLPALPVRTPVRTSRTGLPPRTAQANDNASGAVLVASVVVAYRERILGSLRADPA